MTSRAVMVDTSAYFAIIDKGDSFHFDALHFVKANTLPTVTTNYLLVETLNLINQRLGHHYAVEIGKKLFDPLRTDVIKVSDQDMLKAWHIFQRYDDKSFSFTDCTTFAVMERLNIRSAFTFDEHFKMYGKLSVFP